MNKLIKVRYEFNRPADTTAYAANDAISDSTSAPTTMTFSVPVSVNSNATEYGQYIQVKTARLIKSSNTTTNANFKLFLYETTVTNTNDNAQHALLFTNRLTRTGAIDFVCTTTGASSTCAESYISDVNMTLLMQGANIGGELIATAAYTPASAETFCIELELIVFN